MATKKKVLPKAEEKGLLDYELVYIVNPQIVDESLEATINGVNQFITDRQGLISDVERWGKRKLAYPVEHFLEGTYLLMRFKLSPARCKELEANLKISEQVLRHLLIKTGE